MIISSPLAILNLQNLHSPFDFHPQPNNKHPNPKTISKAQTQKLRRLIESKNNLSRAKDLYIESKRNKTQFGIVLESMLIDALMKSGLVDDAFQVFDEMPDRNVVTWASMIRGCVMNRNSITGISLFVEMLESNVIPNDFAFNAALQACADLALLRFGEQIFSMVIRLGLESDARVRISLIDFYCRCGLMDEAVLIFNKSDEDEVVSCTTLISGFCRNNMFDSAIRVFDQMVSRSVEPNEHTITSILMACKLQLGEQIHGYMIKSMIDRSVYSSSALIELYSRSYEFNKAKLVFEKLDDKNVVAWSSMISCCINNEQADDALLLFHKMVFKGIKPNEFTFSSVIGACGILLGKQLHCLVIKLNLVLENRVSNALITMYSRNGQIEEMRKVFGRIENRDVTSWCAAISGYFQNGFNEKSIKLLCEMHKKGLKPNEYGLSSALSSCANLALFDQGRQFHCLALKTGCDNNLCTGNALINMYAKCGFLNDANSTFDLMMTHDVMSYNSLIHGHAYHGQGHAAIKLFNDMLKSNLFAPNHSTFVAILVACNHMGWVEEALEYFYAMENLYGITPSYAHYVCVIDIMGRAGLISESLHIIKEMPFEPDVLKWKSLLSSCRLHGDVKLGKIAAERVLELNQEDSAAYALMSNLHAMHGEWDDVERVRMMMEERGVKKDAGWSWIEVEKEVHAFVARDGSHLESEIIYQRLEELSEVIKDDGYLVAAGFEDLCAEWE